MVSLSLYSLLMLMKDSEKKINNNIYQEDNNSNKTRFLFFNFSVIKTYR